MWPLRCGAGNLRDGIFLNGFRPHTTASQIYEEDLSPTVLADQLGFRDACISEHHGEPVLRGGLNTIVPKLQMCKAAGLTKQNRSGGGGQAHSSCPPGADTAIQAAVTEHVE